MSDIAVRSGVCRLSVPDGRWLGTGVHGGFCEAEGAVNVSVSADFDRHDLGAVVAERCDAAGFAGDGPALLTAVPQRHARVAASGPVTAVATAGLSNAATIEINPSKEINSRGAADERPPPGTVNLLVAIDGSLSDALLAGALAAVVEAKTATLQATTGFTGTTSDAVSVGSDRGGREISFVGSSTDVGRAIRACVRDALRASLDATYAEDPMPRSVDDADHGAVTVGDPTVFTP